MAISRGFSKLCKNRQDGISLRDHLPAPVGNPIYLFVASAIMCSGRGKIRVCNTERGGDSEIGFGTLW